MLLHLLQIWILLTLPLDYLTHPHLQLLMFQKTQKIPQHFRSKHFLSKCWRNVRTKLENFHTDISLFADEYDFIIITETWLKLGISIAELGLNDYHVFRKKKKKKLNEDISRGGGVLIAVHKSLGCYECQVNVESDDIDVKFVSIYENQRKYIV